MIQYADTSSFSQGDKNHKFKASTALSSAFSRSEDSGRLLAESKLCDPRTGQRPWSRGQPRSHRTEFPAAAASCLFAEGTHKLCGTLCTSPNIATAAKVSSKALLTKTARNPRKLKCVKHSVSNRWICCRQGTQLPEHTACSGTTARLAWEP